MEWLIQNWASLLLLAVVLIFLSRRGGMGCGIGGHAAREGSHPSKDEKSSTDSPPLDPVSGESVSRDTALTSAYHGRIYYFSSRENRDTFEAEPDKFAAADAGDHGQSDRHGGHGCC